MRSRFAILNSIFAGFLQIVLLVQAMLIPRMIIMIYGSTINGLIYSSQQVFNQLNYIEAGYYLAFLYILFKPVSTNNKNSISEIYVIIKRKYRSLFYFLSIILIFFSFVYPLLLGINKSDYFLFVILVFIVGLVNIFNIYFFYKYRSILVSSQKEYVISIIFAFSVIFSIIFSYILIILQVNILLVRIVPLGAVLVRTILLEIHIRRKFSYIFNKRNNKLKVKSNIDLKTIFPAIIFQISISMPVIIPSFIISIIASLAVSSVFSVYNSIFFGLIGLTGIFVVGIPASFGNMFAHEEYDLLKKNINYFETFISIISVVLYACFSILIFSFIQIYISFDTEIEYIDNFYPIIFSIWGIVHNFRIPPIAFFTASGNYKKLLKSNLVYIISIVILGLISGYIFNQYYVILVIIMLSLIRNITLYLYNTKYELFSIKQSLSKLMLSFVLLFVFYKISELFSVNIHNFVEWIIYAFIVFASVLIFTISIYSIFYKNDIKNIKLKIFTGLKIIHRRK